MNKNNTYYVEKMLDDINFIIEHMNGIDKESLEGDPVLEDSMMFRLIQISENSTKLESDYKKKYDAIPWSDITALRNRIVHDYGNVDISIVYDTLTKDIAELGELLKELV